MATAFRDREVDLNSAILAIRRVYQGDKVPERVMFRLAARYRPSPPLGPRRELT